MSGILQYRYFLYGLLMVLSVISLRANDDIHLDELGAAVELVAQGDQLMVRKIKLSSFFKKIAGTMVELGKAFGAQTKEEKEEAAIGVVASLLNMAGDLAAEDEKNKAERELRDRQEREQALSEATRQQQTRLITDESEETAQCNNNHNFIVDETLGDILIAELFLTGRGKQVDLEDLIKRFPEDKSVRVAFRESFKEFMEEVLVVLKSKLKEGAILLLDRIQVRLKKVNVNQFRNPEVSVNNEQMMSDGLEFEEEDEDLYHEESELRRRLRALAVFIADLLSEDGLFYYIKKKVLHGASIAHDVVEDVTFSLIH